MATSILTPRSFSRSQKHLVQSEMGKQYFDRIVFIIDVASSFFSYRYDPFIFIFKGDLSCENVRNRI